MTDHATTSFNDYRLPSSVVTRTDMVHLVHEAERVDNELTTRAIQQQAGQQASDGTVMSQQLKDFLETNSLAFDQDTTDRLTVVKELRKLKSKAPVIHMTFAVQADGESTHQLVDWVRGQVHPQALIEIGLQPALIGGVYLRLPNHVQDFSLRGLLHGGHEVLLKELEAARGTK